MDAQVISERPHKTRAQVLRDKVQIRLAVDGVGQKIAVILAENGVVLQGADWSKIFPHWLIATVDDDVIGCIQVMPAKPVGYLEFLMVKPSVPFKLRAIAVRKLMQQGMATLEVFGATYAAAGVENNNLMEVIKHAGAVPLGTRVTMIKRLKE